MLRSRGCWQEASAPHHVGISTGQLECPCNMAASFLQDEQSKEKKEEATMFSMTYSLKSHSHFCLFLCTHNKPLRPVHTQWERISSTFKEKTTKKFLDLKPLQLLVVGSSLLIKIPKPIFSTTQHCQLRQGKLYPGEVSLIPNPRQSFQLRNSRPIRLSQSGPA